MKISLTNIGSASSRWLSVKATPLLSGGDSKESELVTVDESLLKNLQNLRPNERSSDYLVLKVFGHLSLY